MNTVESLPYVLSALAVSVVVNLWVALRHTRAHYASPCPGRQSEPLSLLRPIRGREAALEALLESLVVADPRGINQIVFALESESDEAYVVVKRFVDDHPDRDISIVIDAGGGEGLPRARLLRVAFARARHERVVFTDADAFISEALLASADEAFRGGADAVYALSVQDDADDSPLAWWHAAMHQHVYGVFVAHIYRTAGLRYYSGCFMGYTREALARLGGLRRFLWHVADDMAIGRAAQEGGLRQALLPVPVLVRENTSSVGEALERLLRLNRVTFWTAPCASAFFLAFHPAALSLAAVASAAFAGEPYLVPVLAVGTLAISRVAVAQAQDRAVIGRVRPMWFYLLIPLVDAVFLAAWPFAFGRHFEWRGRTYALEWGGKCRVVLEY